jgi:hypothetical protein
MSKPTIFIVGLTAWLVAGMTSFFAGWVEDGTVLWWLTMGIPGALYALILYGGMVVAAICLFLALAHSPPRRPGQ